MIDSRSSSNWLTSQSKRSFANALSCSLSLKDTIMLQRGCNLVYLPSTQAETIWRALLGPAFTRIRGSKNWIRRPSKSPLGMYTQWSLPSRSRSTRRCHCPQIGDAIYGRPVPWMATVKSWFGRFPNHTKIIIEARRNGSTHTIMMMLV